MDTQPQPRPSLATLPVELRQAIFVCLESPVAAVRLSRTCRAMYAALKGSEPLLLHQMVRRRMGGVIFRLAMAHYECVLHCRELRRLQPDWTPGLPNQELPVYGAKCLALPDCHFPAHLLQEFGPMGLAGRLSLLYDGISTGAVAVAQRPPPGLDHTWTAEEIIHVIYFDIITDWISTAFLWNFPIHLANSDQLTSLILLYERHIRLWLDVLFERLGACLSSKKKSDLYKIEYAERMLRIT